jgi:carboxyl-terminal processing protease
MSEPRKKNTTRLLAILVVVVVVFFAGATWGERRSTTIPEELQASEDRPALKELDVFFEVWDTLREKYPFEDVPSTEDLVLSATEGLARAYGDPYTVFFSPEDAEVFDDDINGEFSGVGMEVGIEDDLITVIAPLKDSPAERAGMRPGDRVLQIDGELTLDLSLDQAVTLIRGERGSTVSLLVAREGTDEPFIVEIVRDLIQVPTIETSMIDDVFVISLFNFTANSPEDFRDALSEFADANTNNLILDLRGNPGGYLSAAVDMASWFLPEGKVIVKESLGQGEEGDIFRSRGYDVFTENLEMMVLIDGGSASASEILAGALSEYGIAELVGSQTFGKGSVQQVVYLNQGSLLKVTVAEWQTPNGVSISKEGLTPDHEVPFTLEDYDADRDPQLDYAVELLQNR